MDIIIIGLILGILAGIIDLIPMYIKKLTWDAKLSAFSMWIIAGFLISITNLPVPGFLKGIIISFLVLVPCAFIIGWKKPMNIIPIAIMTLTLGAALGYLIQIFSG